MLEYLVATGNRHKTEAIRSILADYPITLTDLSEQKPVPEPEETGATFLENALIKSRYYAEMTGFASMADDSGLEIDALDGRPGVLSARYAGSDTPHSVKMARLLEEMAGVPQEKRTARFRCVAAVTFPDGREYSAEGAMEGVIAFEPRGSGGFGYDPIVFIPQLGCTVAELTPEQKDSFSHRGIAFRRLMEKLKLERPPGPGSAARHENPRG
jgi:XTP/dITP diphosphohydrolase